MAMGLYIRGHCTTVYRIFLASHVLSCALDGAATLHFFHVSGLILDFKNFDNAFVSYPFPLFLCLNC